MRIRGCGLQPKSVFESRDEALLMIPFFLKFACNLLYFDSIINNKLVGCGSGYLTSCFGRLLSNAKGSEQTPLGIRGKAWGIDFVPYLVEMSEYNTKKADADLLESGTVSFLRGDGWKGLPDEAPFQAIHVGAAADTFPKNLMMQLAVGGVMIIPVGPQLGGQALYRIERVKESPTFNTSDFVMTQLLGVRYVPLVHAQK